MSRPEPISVNPILPDKQPEERPLFVIMTIMSFLTAMTLLFSLIGYRVSQSWQNDLAQSVTIQILEDDSTLAQETGDNVETLVQSLHAGARTKVLRDKDARDLLRPWLGDMTLPDDLPLPTLIEVQDFPPDKVGTLRERLIAEGFNADVDDHSQWQAQIRRSWRALQLGMLSIIIVIIGASIAISSYATQSVLRARQSIIDVLAHVGARDGFIARLFVSRFLSLGLKGAFAGTIAALVAFFIFGLWTRGFNDGQTLNLTPRLGDLVFLFVLAGIMGLISAGTAGHVTLSKLKRDRDLS